VRGAQQKHRTATSTADSAEFDRIKRQLVKEGKIRPGLTFHGLRKSLGKAAADAGFSENDIAGALGQANPASARVYTQEAARNQGALTRRLGRAQCLRISSPRTGTERDFGKRCEGSWKNGLLSTRFRRQRQRSKTLDRLN
jgi:hypothetical protein